MDVVQYMQQSLANQARHTALLEAILEGIQSINESGVIVHQGLTDGVQIQPAVTCVEPTEQAGPVQEAKQAGTVEETKPAETAKSERKPWTADQVRAALMSYAKVEGNSAAMELLKSHGASSVTGLVELGDDKAAEFMDALGPGHVQ